MARIVAIGASQGGIEALHALISGLPANFPAPILIVVHIGLGPSMLPSLLNDIRRLPASFAAQDERIRSGHIYIAPPDHHLLVTDGRLKLSRGPRENWTRPAIDPLFRSVAEEYGRQAIGVILTGNLSDGTVGLYEIKRRGGTAIVQDPGDAEARSMPLSALNNVAVDYCVPLAELPALLSRLVREAEIEEPEEIGVRAMPELDLERPMQRPVAQTCPECGGAMREETIGNVTQFRCHIGHVLNAEVLAGAQLEILERDLSSVLRLLNERAELSRDLAHKHNAHGNTQAQSLWLQAAEEATKREEAIRNMTEAEWIRPESLGVAE
ncbi:MAG TPA: chemotaxis protein CheB [Rhizomicrobium sp.]|nr:chemotaxis protein CheB [Rhizomicrobium sp.]